MRSTFDDDIAQSVYNTLSNKLLEQGAYHIISIGDKSALGTPLDKFYPVIDKRISSSAGIVWQSLFHNFVYESGVLNLPVPPVASGVYVDGSFYAKSSSKSHYIDYANGRVIFNSAQSTSSVVTANFSVSEFTFTRPDASRSPEDSVRYDNNSRLYATGIPANPDTYHLPLILMELEDAGDEPFQFGGTNSANPTYKFTILSDSQSQVEQVGTLFTSLKQKSFAIIPKNEGPVFNSLGDLVSTYSFYNWRIKSSNLGTFEDIRYLNAGATERDAQKLSRIFVGVVKMKIFAMRTY